MFGGLVSARHPIGEPERKGDGLPIWAGIYRLVLAFFEMLVSQCRGGRLDAKQKRQQKRQGQSDGTEGAEHGGLRRLGLID